MPSAERGPPAASAAAASGALGPRSVLSVRDLKTHFFTDAGTVKAVNGVTLGLEEGETLAIVGESGSGKSVTGLTVMRLLQRTSARVVGGSITFRDREGNEVDLLGLSEAEMQRRRGRDIAMIFQDPMSSLNPVFTVGEQIAEPIRIHRGADRRTARREALDLLREVGISDPETRINAYPHQLSGGMRQRVCIALALACSPRLLIADEPTTALDVTIQAQIIALLKKLQERHGTAMIFVTHDLKLVGEIADRIAVMYASQVVEEGPVADVLGHPRHPLHGGAPGLHSEADIRRRRRRAQADPGALAQSPRAAASLPLPRALHICARALRRDRAGARVRSRRATTCAACAGERSTRERRRRDGARAGRRRSARRGARTDQAFRRRAPRSLPRRRRRCAPSRGSTLRIAPGEALGVVGESGSGKSTLGRLVLRLIEPTRGRVTFDGTDLSALRPAELRGFRRHMQMIFQDPFASLNARMTVRDALLEPIALHRGLRGRAAVEAAERLMAQVGLTPEQMGRYPRAFSGGQRQRVAIARALASSPRFIVADEPVSALDVSVQAEVVNLLQELQARPRAGLDVHQPRPLGRRGHLGPRHGPLSRPRHGDRADRGALHAPRSSLFRRPPPGDPRRDLARGPADPERRDPERRRAAIGLRLPHPLPLRDPRLRAHRARAARGRPRPHQGVHPR